MTAQTQAHYGPYTPAGVRGPPASPTPPVGATEPKRLRKPNSKYGDGADFAALDDEGDSPPVGGHHRGGAYGDEPAPAPRGRPPNTGGYARGGRGGGSVPRRSPASPGAPGAAARALALSDVHANLGAIADWGGPSDALDILMDDDFGFDPDELAGGVAHLGGGHPPLGGAGTVGHSLAPVSTVSEPGGAGDVGGVGDEELGARYQALHGRPAPSANRQWLQRRCDDAAVAGGMDASPALAGPDPGMAGNGVAPALYPPSHLGGRYAGEGGPYPSPPPSPGAVVGTGRRQGGGGGARGRARQANKEAAAAAAVAAEAAAIVGTVTGKRQRRRPVREANTPAESYLDSEDEEGTSAGNIGDLDDDEFSLSDPGAEDDDDMGTPETGRRRGRKAAKRGGATGGTGARRGRPPGSGTKRGGGNAAAAARAARAASGSGSPQEEDERLYKPWTIEESEALVDGVWQCGGGKWADIKKLANPAIEARSAVDLKDKWRNLLRIAQSSPGARTTAKHELPAALLSRVRELADRRG